MDIDMLVKKAKFYNKFENLSLRESCEKAIQEKFTNQDISHIAVELDMTLQDVIDLVENKFKEQI
jgi:hypothetical protein